MKSNKQIKIIYQSDSSKINGELEEFFCPKTISELSYLVKKYPFITIRGAGTGIAGGAVPQNDVVISMLNFNRILKFDEKRHVIEVEAGRILDDLNEFLSEKGYEFPVIPYSKNICTIGGMIANNSFGIFSAKYGSVSRYVESIKIMDSEGIVKEKGRVEISDFIGLEGITGIILSVKLRVVKKTKKTFDVVKIKNLERIDDLIREIKARNDVCMLNFFDKNISPLLGFEDDNTIIVGYESNNGIIKNKEADALVKKIFGIYPILIKQNYEKIENLKIFFDKSKEIINLLNENKIPVFGDLGFGNIHLCFTKNHIPKLEELIKYAKKNRSKINTGMEIGLIKKNLINVINKNIYFSVKKRNDSLGKFNINKIIDKK
jgi:UDP-N-acetylenolpyruvoylglucosamine reductase